MDWLGSLLQTAIGWLLDTILGGSVRHWLKEFPSRFSNPVRAFLGLSNNGAFRTTAELHVGMLTTEWIHLEGDPNLPYTRERIRCWLHDSPCTLPHEFQRIRDALEETRRQAEVSGMAAIWNSPIPRVLRVELDRRPNGEYPILNVHLGRSDFFTFVAVAHHLDDPLFEQDGKWLTARELFVSNMNWYEPLELIAQSFGVYLAIVTKDNWLVIVKRSAKTISREEFSCAVTEGLSLERDLDEWGRPDPFKTALRGCAEELGLEPGNDIRADEVRFLSVGVNRRYCQYALLGYARVALDSKWLAARRSVGGAKDARLEACEMHFVAFSPETIAGFIQQKDPWSSGGVACILQTLVAEFGMSRVEKAFGQCRKCISG